MTDDRYIWVRNWERFQHYRDRTPEWIKSYTEVMSADDYLDLSLARRGILHGLWLEFASSRRRLRLDTASLSRRINGRITMADLESLNHAGFIHFVASSALAECERAYSEALASRAPARSRDQIREEKEKEPQELRTATTPTPNGNHTSGVQGLSGISTEAELTRLLAWIGPDADTRTAAVLRHNWTRAPDHVRAHILAALEQAHPRNRARWLVGSIKAETRKVAT